MNEQNHDPFHILFQKAQVDLPDHLKRRLLSIPEARPSISFWDIRSWLPVVALVPGLIWFLVTKSVPFWKWLGIKISSLTSAVPSIGSFTISATALYIGTGALVLAILVATWLYLRTEQESCLIYARQLTSTG